MTQILTGIYKLVRTGSLSDIDPFQVQEKKSTDYNVKPVHCREDSLLIYGPGLNNEYEVVLLRSSNSSYSDLFSIYRTTILQNAEEVFLLFKDKLAFLVDLHKNYCSTAIVQKIADTLRNNPGWHVMHVSIYLSFRNLVSHPEVIQKMNIQCVHSGVSALHIAIETKQMQYIQLLLDMEADCCMLDNKGNSIFHYAASTSKEIIEVIAKKNIYSINNLNNSGESPLHLACILDKPDCVRALIRAGANINITISTSSDAMDTSVETSDRSNAGQLLDTYPYDLDNSDMKNGGTPLHWSKSEAVIEAFVENGCDVNACNFNNDSALHIMVERERLSCVIALLSYGANPSSVGGNGNTPLHLAVKSGNLPIIEALIVFGSDINALNYDMESPRHIAATTDYSSSVFISLISNSGSKEKSDIIIYTLNAVGATRCNFNDDCAHNLQCKEGCSADGTYDGIEPDPLPYFPNNSKLYEKLFDSCTSGHLENSSMKDSQESLSKKVAILSLDGGGIRGLVLAKMLSMIEDFLEKPVIECFDWIAGTSTGGILCLGLAVGKTINECVMLYFRLKTKVFKGNRPYDSNLLEEFLKKELGGDDLKMSDLNSSPRIFVTGVLADRFPAELHLFRNYDSPYDELQKLNAEDVVIDEASSSSIFAVPPKPSDQPVWLAARATGAAPTYFRASCNVVDGGLISNNPTLDLLTEIHEFNRVMKLLDKHDEIVKIKAVVSLGTGKMPVTLVNDIDVFRPDSVWNAAKAVRGMSALTNLVVDQATSSDGQVVKRAKAWCDMINVPYIRITPELSSSISIDETSNEILVHMLLETMIYVRRQTHSLCYLKKLLIDDNN